MTVSHGKPYAGNLHVRFDEGADVPDEGGLALLHQLNVSRRDAERPRAQRMLGILRIQQICNFLSILCLSAPLREKNSPLLPFLGLKWYTTNQIKKDYEKFSQ